MIGKVQDMVTSAIVIGAMDKASADSSAATSKNANAEVIPAKNTHKKKTIKKCFYSY